MSIECHLEMSNEHTDTQTGDKIKQNTEKPKNEIIETKAHTQNLTKSKTQNQ